MNIVIKKDFSNGKTVVALDPVAEIINLPNDYRTNIVQCIVDTVPTQAVYVFGSYARGEENTDSDIDLYVVTSDKKKKHWEYASDIRYELLWMPNSKDIITSPTDRFNQNKDKLWAIEYMVNTEGKKIYER